MAIAAARLPPESLELRTLQGLIELSAPARFSFSLDADDFADELEDSVNDVADALDVMYILFDEHDDGSESNLADDFTLERFIKQACETSAVVTEPILRWHLNYVLYFLNEQPSVPDDCRLNAQHALFAHPLDFINTDPPSSELYWYRALVILHEAEKRNGMTKADVLGLMDCATKISDFDKIKGEDSDYAAGILRLSLTCMNAHPPLEYIGVDTFIAFAEALKNHGCNPGYFLPEIHHVYTNRYLARSPQAKYFDFVLSYFLTTKPEELSSYSTRVRIPKARTYLGAQAIDHVISLGDFELLKLASHSFSIFDPVFQLFPSTYTVLNTKLNEHLCSRLFLNSEGMIVRDRVFHWNAVADMPISVREEFILAMKNFFADPVLWSQSLPGILKPPAGVTHESFPFPLNVFDRMRALSVCVAEPEVAVIKADLDRYISSYCKASLLSFATGFYRDRARLEFFSPTDMLALTYQGLGSYRHDADTPECPKRDMVLNLLGASLDIALQAKAIADRPDSKNPMIGYRSKPDLFYALAESVIKKLLVDKKTLILQAGEPVKLGKESSIHAFYVVLRYHPAEDAFYIMIVNGGGYFTSYHYRDPSLDSSEFTDARFGLYFPVVFTPLKCTDPTHQKFLKNYIYRVLSLAYGSEVLTHKGKAFSTLTNVYLGKNSSGGFQFKGYEGYETTLVQRRPYSNRSYPAQLSSDCTMHNLKLSLVTACGFNSVLAGIFNDVLLFATRSLIAEVAPAPAAAGAGTSIPFSAASSAKAASSGAGTIAASEDARSAFLKAFARATGLDHRALGAFGLEFVDGSK